MSKKSSQKKLLAEDVYKKLEDLNIRRTPLDAAREKERRLSVDLHQDFSVLGTHEKIILKGFNFL